METKEKIVGRRKINGTGWEAIEEVGGGMEGVNPKWRWKVCLNEEPMNIVIG